MLGTGRLLSGSALDRSMTAGVMTAGGCDLLVLLSAGGRTHGLVILIAGWVAGGQMRPQF
jgi:hypothetical protein